MNTVSKSPVLTVLALVVSAGGIGVLWAAGVVFPVPVPPGIVILLTGAVALVLLRRRWWSGLIAVLLGLFVIVGFLASPEGLANFAGDAGPVVATGQRIQLVGVVIAVVAGLVTTWRARRAVADRVLIR